MASSWLSTTRRFGVNIVVTFDLITVEVDLEEAILGLVLHPVGLEDY